ncbi:YsnF/AvaK domain-containing protein [Sphingomonas sp. PL-96]|uniref:YsnF/AvaK domain-containing protein n=1 Tax=Sphingomonas sp. PL-96 TaxID=2887201 RepID=UPI001E3D4690|nr:YsnF/AvaK domain-containing protein [Sphingomonas sp. PL-96]MCC2978010.1 YsnF/AvaK domain-containing protein [Sphingomonas sp. PL-96]
MSDDLHIPIVQEEAHVSKRVVATEKVRVSTTAEEQEVLVRETLRREQVDVTRVPIGREVTEVPATRTEGDVTIVPVFEERLVVEKRLFLVEELHVRRTVIVDPVELPTTLRRTRVEVERTQLDQQEEH